MIEIKNLNFSYKNEQVLENINLTIDDGDFILIYGENGSGKSTLLKCILGINKVDNGIIKIDNTDINKYKDFSNIGYVEQFKKNSQDVSLTTYEYFRLISKDKQKINEIITKMGIEHLRNKDISTMSGGERQKVIIAKTLLKDLKYLILDEPNTGLDFKSRQEMNDNLTKLNNQGITIIIISHHLDEVSCQINKIYDIKKKTLENNVKENCEYC